MKHIPRHGPPQELHHTSVAAPRIRAPLARRTVQDTALLIHRRRIPSGRRGCLPRKAQNIKSAVAVHHPHTVRQDYIQEMALPRDPATAPQASSSVPGIPIRTRVCPTLQALRALFLVTPTILMRRQHYRALALATHMRKPATRHLFRGAPNG